MEMNGFKFNFEIGKHYMTYKHDGENKLCKPLEGALIYYGFLNNNRFCKVKAVGKII